MRAVRITRRGLLALLALLVGACQGPLVTTSPPPPGPSHGSVPSAVTEVAPASPPPATATSGSAANVQGETIAPSPTSGSLPIRRARVSCTALVYADLPPGFLAPGKILVVRFGSSPSPPSGPLMVLSKENYTLRPLSDVPPLDFSSGVSPHGKRLLYGWVDTSAPPGNMPVWLIVLGSDLEVEATLKDDADRYWLDDNRLVFIRGIDPYSGIAPSSLEAEVVDLRSGQRQRFTLQVPGYWMPDGPVLVFWTALLNPALSRYVYPKEGEYRGISPVLVDRERGEVLWSLEPAPIEQVGPQWSPDGSRLAVAVYDYEAPSEGRFLVYLVDPEGRAELWVDVLGYYAGQPPLQLRWSPDGRYLAIAGVSGERGVPFLLLDTVERQLLDYCLPSNFYGREILWSPDSTQVIVPRIGEPAIVLDLKREKAGFVLSHEDTDLIPVAWLAEE